MTLIDIFTAFVAALAALLVAIIIMKLSAKIFNRTPSRRERMESLLR
jgi:hypothetical protein